MPLEIVDIELFVKCHPSNSGATILHGGPMKIEKSYPARERRKDNVPKRIEWNCAEVFGPLTPEYEGNPARREMRDAIARNISDATTVRDQLGPQATDAYIKQLAGLRLVVDQTEPESSAALWQGSLNVMEDQKRLLANAERRIRTKG